VEASARLRLFCALRLPDETIDAIVSWQQRELRGGRTVPPSNLHLTLAFLGSRPAADLRSIAAALRSAAADARDLRLRVRGYRETRSVGMLAFDDEGGRAAALAERLHALLEELGVYQREARPWLAHLTVLRFRERPRLHPPLPDLGGAGSGVVCPSDAAVYISRLRPDGARYEVLEHVALGH
jgi:RNA 2',3'-cyclic 3'-phosphodiesterase